MLRINSTRTHEERGADPNQTPPAVVRALAHHEHLPQWILDPAVGLGHVLDTLRALGHNVIGRDVVLVITSLFHLSRRASGKS